MLIEWPAHSLEFFRRLRGLRSPRTQPWAQRLCLLWGGFRTGHEAQMEKKLGNMHMPLASVPNAKFARAHAP